MCVELRMKLKKETVVEKLVIPFVYSWNGSACEPHPENIPDEELYKRLQGLPRDAFGVLLMSSLLETPVLQLDCYHRLTSSSRS